jgi:hypothetical protein
VVNNSNNDHFVSLPLVFPMGIILKERPEPTESAIRTVTSNKSTEKDRHVISSL